MDIPKPSSSFSSFPSLARPLSFKTTAASKLDYLYEIEYLPEDSKVPPSQFPVINPYTIYCKPQSSFKKKVKKLLGADHSSPVKEYVQASNFSAHPIFADEKEQFLPIDLPTNLLPHWIQDGYTHIHIGAIKLALTFHGRKGLPVVSNLAVLDTRFRLYPHATLGTISSTLNAGTVFITLVPNYNISLQDPHALDCLKVQVQISGTPQVATAVVATLHYQIAYRVQNHSFDIPVPDFVQTQDALFLNIDAALVPTCTYVPRQLSSEDLKSLLPAKWTTHYENFHGRNEAITAIEPVYTRQADDTVETSFHHQEATTINPFSSEVLSLEPLITNKHQDYDCTCAKCNADSYQVELDLEYERKYFAKPRKKKSPQQKL